MKTFSEARQLVKDAQNRKMEHLQEADADDIYDQELQKIQTECTHEGETDAMWSYPPRFRCAACLKEFVKCPN